MLNIAQTKTWPCEMALKTCQTEQENFMGLGVWKEKIKMNFIDLTGQVHILPNPY